MAHRLYLNMCERLDLIVARIRFGGFRIQSLLLEDDMVLSTINLQLV